MRLVGYGDYLHQQGHLDDSTLSSLQEEIVERLGQGVEGGSFT